MAKLFTDFGTSALRANSYGMNTPGQYYPPGDPMWYSGGYQDPPASTNPYQYNKGGAGNYYGMPQPTTTPSYSKGMATNYYGAQKANANAYTSPASEQMRQDAMQRNLELIDSYIERQREENEAGWNEEFGGMGQDIYQGQFDEQYNEYLAEIARQESMARAQYSPEIGGLSDMVSDLKKGLSDVQSPFDRYLDRRDEIGGAVGPADDLAAHGMDAARKKIYDDAQGEVKRTLSDIDVKLGPKVSAAMTEQVRSFEQVAEDVLRTDVDALSRLHAKSSEYAEAMSQAAYSDDIYKAIASKTRIEAELNDSIQEKQEDLARARAAQAATIKAIRDQPFDFEEPTYEDVLMRSMSKWFTDHGVKPDDLPEIGADFQALSEQAAYNSDPNAWRRGVWIGVNKENFARSGIDVDGALGNLTPEQNKRFNTYFEGHDLHRVLNSGSAADKVILRRNLDFVFGATTANGIISDLNKHKRSFESVKGTNAQMLIDAYDMKEALAREWETVQQGSGKGIQERAKSQKGVIQPSLIGQYLQKHHGLTPAAAAGVLANIKHESGFNAGAEGDRNLSTSSYGLFQHREGRWRALQSSPATRVAAPMTGLPRWTSP